VVPAINADWSIVAERIFSPDAIFWRALATTVTIAVVAQVAEADELAALRSTTVSGATVDGDHASVRADQMTGVPTAYRRDVSLVRVDGHWFIDTPG